VKVVDENTDETERNVLLSGGHVKGHEASEEKCGNHCEMLTVSWGLVTGSVSRQ
jgi:hypothetical protein